MNKNIKIAILGGGGRTGKYLVNHLIRKGYQLKILLRNIPETDKTSIDQFSLNLKNPCVEIVQGDAVEYEAIHRLLSGCEAVISTIGQRPGEPMVASAATGNIVRAMDEYAIRRYILVAGVNVDTPSDRKSEPVKAATAWMKSNFPLIHDDRAKAYDMLVGSHLDWTLIRLPVIHYTDEQFPVEANLGDCAGTKISTVDISRFLEKQLFNTTYFRQAPFLYNV